MSAGQKQMQNNISVLVMSLKDSKGWQEAAGLPDNGCMEKSAWTYQMVVVFAPVGSVNTWCT